MIAIFGETRIAYPRSILYPSSSTNILAIHQSVITFFIFRQIISVRFNNTWPSSSPLKQNYFYFAQISYNEFLFLFFVIFKQNFKLFFFAQISYNETTNALSTTALKKSAPIVNVDRATEIRLKKF